MDTLKKPRITVAFCPPGIPADCPVLPLLREHIRGLCDRCGAKLPRRRKRWCSDECSRWAYLEFSKHHDWNAARAAALERDGYKCVKCERPQRRFDGPLVVRLSVNHIVPRNGQGYGRGCHHQSQQS